MHARARELLSSLRLAPHPEGGHYRRIWTSALIVEPRDGRGPRTASSAIQFLLDAGETSRWHRVSSDEAWLHAEGAGVRLHTLDWPKRELRTHLVAAAGQGCAPAHVVPAGTWQAAEPVGAFAFVTCIVAPSFDFADFELMTPGGQEMEWLGLSAPSLARLA